MRFADSYIILRIARSILRQEGIAELMKSLRLAVIAFLAAGLTSAAGKADFSGVWEMDLKQSDFGAIPPPDSLKRTIEQHDSALIMTDEQVSPLGPEKAVRKYTTDGKETTYQWTGSDVKSAAHWDGDVLVIVGKVDAGGMDVVITSRMTVSADGKRLTEDDKIASADGTELAAFKIVLVKK
jgi:hypothetical protein